MDYQLWIGNSDKISLLKAKTLKINRQRDHRNSMSFTLVTDNNYIPDVGLDVTFLYDIDVKFGGKINSIKITRISPDGTLEIDVECVSFTFIPQRRSVTDYFTNQTAADIISTYVTNILYQEGISAGYIEEDNDIIAEYDVEGAKSIKEIFDDLAEIKGYVWWIDDTKVLHFREDIGLTNCYYAIEENGTFKDFNNIEVTRSIENYHNKVFVVGGVADTGDRIVVAEQDNSEIASVQAIEGGSGVYGTIEENSAIETEAKATTLAQKLLSKYKVKPTEISFDTDTEGFKVSDKVYVNLPTFGINQKYYVVDSIQYSDCGKEHLKFRVVMKELSSSDKTQPDNKYNNYFSKMVKKINDISKTAKVISQSSGNAEGHIEVGYVTYSGTANTKLSINYNTAFTVEPVVSASILFTPENIAQGKDSDAESYQSTNTPAKAVDGTISDSNSWLSSAPGNHWIMVDFATSYTIGRVILYNGNQNGTNPISNILLQYWDGSTWQDVSGSTVSGNTNTTWEFIFHSPISTQKLRLYSIGTGTAIRVREFQIFTVMSESPGIQIYHKKNGNDYVGTDIYIVRQTSDTLSFKVSVSAYG